MFKKYDPNNPVNQVCIPSHLVWSKPWHMISTLFGTGLVGKGAGTLGTVFGALIFIVLSPSFSTTFWFIATVILFVVGAIAAEKTSQALGVEDHGGIVIDEVVGIWLVYTFLPHGALWWIAGFIAFRFFDIVKCPPVNKIDETLKNGWGIMLDDVVAAVYAWIVVAFLGWLFG